MILDGRNIRVEARTSPGKASGSNGDTVRRAVGHHTLSVASASVRANRRWRVQSTSEPERVPEAVEHIQAPEIPHDSQDSQASQASQVSQNSQDARDVPDSRATQASQTSQASQTFQATQTTEALVTPVTQVTATEPAQMVESQAQLVQPIARHTVSETVQISQNVEPAPVATPRATPEVAMPQYTDTHPRVDMEPIPGHYPGMAPYPPPCCTPPGYFIPGQHPGGFMHAPGFHGNGMYPPYSPYYPYGHGQVPYPGFCPPMGYYPYSMPYGPMGGAYGSTTASSTPPPPIHTPDTQTYDMTRVDAGPGIHQG